MAKYACSVCAENCKTNCIYCETCNLWVHYTCDSLDKDDRKKWQDIHLGYVCVRCRSTDDETFDFLMGLERLRQAAKHGIKKLTPVVAREHMFMKSVPLETLVSSEFESHVQDAVSNAILNAYGCLAHAALATTGDGDCLFNAVSIILTGDESRSVELKYRCCIEMITNKANVMNHRSYPRMELLSGDYDKECVDCAKPGSYSTVYRIVALSNVLNTPIQSVYPCINGSKDIAFQTLNSLFKPTSSDPEKEKITIMWTNTNLPQKLKPPRQWRPNHLVPLVDVKQTVVAKHTCILPSFLELSKRSSRPIIIHDPPGEATRSTDKPRARQQKRRKRLQLAESTPSIQTYNTYAPLSIQDNEINLENIDVPQRDQDSSTHVLTPERELDVSPRVTTSVCQLDLSPCVGSPKCELDSSLPRVTTSVPKLDLSPCASSPVPEIDISPGVGTPKRELDTSPPRVHTSVRKLDESPWVNSPVPEIDISPGVGIPERELDTSPPRVHTSVRKLDESPWVSTPDREIDISPRVGTPERELDLSPRVGTPEREIDIPPRFGTRELDTSPLTQLSIIEEESFSLTHDEDVTNSDVNGELSVEDIDGSLSQFTAGPLKKFMDLETTMKTLKGPDPVLNEVPVGRKDGMYFVVNNESNVEKRKSGKKSDFWDDCGAWENGATPCSTYVQRDGNLCNVVKRSGVFCSLRQADRKRTFVTLEPQPADEDVIEVHRCYRILKTSPKGPDQFRKRVTWLEKSPNTMPEIRSDVALIEYIGTYSGRQHHVSVKHSDTNLKYIRTKPSVHTHLKKQLRNNGVKKVERDINMNNEGDFDKQRNEKQLRNIKYTISKKNGETKTQNIADHIICVEEMSKSHEFVQSVKHVQGTQHPLVTLYTTQQIMDIKRFCCKDEVCVLGIDKTYNLGEFHVTPTVYKDMSVIKRTTNDHPICFGPTLVHQSSTTKSYSSFMHDIADNLSDEEIKRLTIGSDEELAFKNAIRRCFPGCTHVLCTHHLRQNTNKYMDDTVGYPAKDRKEIVSAIYGDTGLVENTDIDTYSAKLHNLKQTIDSKDQRVGEKKFRPYFENRLIPILEKHVIQPVKNRKVKPNWTNNNCESANHVLKTATNWKGSDMPTFITTLYDIIIAEQVERCRAMRDMGNFKLSDTFSHHQIDIDHWSHISEEQRVKRRKRFLSDTGKSNMNTVISSNGMRSTQRTPTAGRKPCQTKRKRAEKSRTPSKAPVAKRRI